MKEGAVPLPALLLVLYPFKPSKEPLDGLQTQREQDHFFCHARLLTPLNPSCTQHYMADPLTVQAVAPVVRFMVATTDHGYTTRFRAAVT